MGASAQITALPEMLGRRDAQHGPWSVHECAPVRGMPSTNIVDRTMTIPHGDGEMERCVRAHEMMHAKISPGEDFERWVNRGIASEQALRCVEELRVNYLCNLAGFDVKKNLSDGGESADGERCAIAEDWAGAVYTTVAYMETASLNQFITGVRRHNPEWAASLRAIVNRMSRLISKVPRYDLASTNVDRASGLSPHGFTYTERFAEFVDRLAHPPVPEEDEDETATDASGDTGDERTTDGDATSGDGKDKKKPTKKAPVSLDDIKKSQVAPPQGEDGWATLKPLRMPLNRPAPGGLGKRRSPTMIGRSPRRIERMLTDPHRRIFDRVTRGNGGVVLIDASGSMGLTTENVKRIVEAAPGATVAMYTADTEAQPVNLWILADRGRMVAEIPAHGHGNGVDLPAIEWAVKNRQKSISPVVWITDGYCFGLTNRNMEWEAFQCVKFALANNVIVRPDVEHALKALHDLARNKKPVTWWPGHWRSVFRKFQGKGLRSKPLSKSIR